MVQARRHARAGSHAGELAVAVAVAVALAIGHRAFPGVVAVVVVTVLAAVVLLLTMRTCFPPAVRDDETRWLRVATGVVFAVHLGLGLLINSSTQLVEVFGGDAVTYHLGATEIVHHWNAGTPVDPGLLPVGKEGFLYGLGALYWVFGSWRGAGLAVTALFAAAIVPLVYDTTRRLYGPAAARAAAVMVMVLPGFLIWTSQLLREPVILFFLALAANATVRLTERFTIWPYLVLGGAVGLLMTLRANVGLVVAGALLLGLVIGGGHLLVGLAKGLAVFALVAVVVLSAGVGSRGFQLTSGTDLQAINDMRRALASTANSGVLPDADISTGRRAAGFLPIGLVNFAFGPFPWQVANVRQLGGALEAITVWFLVPSLWRGWRGRRLDGPGDRRWLVLVAPAIAVAVALSLLLGNYGTIVRERLQVLVLLIPIAGYGWTIRRTTEIGAPGSAVAGSTVTVLTPS